MKGTAATSFFLLVALLLIAGLTYTYVHQSQYDKSQEEDVVTSHLRIGTNANTTTTSTSSAISADSAVALELTSPVESSEETIGSDEATLYVEFLAEKFSKPFEFDYNKDGTIYPHQLLHLHHMKTGGTSMDSLMRCALTRWQKVIASDAPTSKRGVSLNATIPSSPSTMPGFSGNPNSIPYSVIHECSSFMYDRCRTGDDASCQARINSSSVMSYCAPLMDLNAFGWQPPTTGHEPEAKIHKESVQLQSPDHGSLRQPHVITVLRHPVDRVWSMFRFKTKMCYGCRNLTDIYDSIAKGVNLTSSVCQEQLFNHQTRNMVSTWLPNNPEQMVDEATYNIKHYVTFLGMTAYMNDTATMVGMLFPFMNETLSESSNNTETCPMPHRNASPLNNGCLANRTHWNLPPHPPDDATVQAILKYNAMDMEVYRRGLLHFEYQKRALGLYSSDAE